jgi:hypothetical protein
MSGHAGSPLASLKKLMRKSVVQIEPATLLAHLDKESDRSVMILAGCILQDTLEGVLEQTVKDRVNKEELGDLFRFEGPLGSFSNCIKIGQTFGILDHDTKRIVEIAKELRNVAAHCGWPIHFGTTEVIAVVASIASKAPHRAGLLTWNAADIRSLYILICAAIAAKMIDPGTTLNTEGALALAFAHRESRERRTKP